MSLVFTTQQIQTMSSDLLTLPKKVNAPGTGLIAQKAAYAAQAPPLLATDSNQEVFSNAWEAAVSSYHAELVLLNLDQRTDYDDANITNGANGVKANGSHFPLSPPWTSLTPMLLPSNQGMPATTASGPDESQSITGFTSQVSDITTGFTSGSADVSGTIAGDVISPSGDISGFSVSDRVLVQMGTLALFGVIALIHSGDITVTFSGTPVDGPCEIQNFFPGFTNAQRQGQASLGSYATVYASLRDQFKTAVGVWDTLLVGEQTALVANADQVNGAHVTAALANVNTAITAYTTWLALPDLAVNGLLSDTGLTNLQSASTTRDPQITARVAQIYSDLGSVTQNADGSYTGAGAYFSLFQIIDVRCAIGIGTLTKYDDNIRNQAFFDKQINADNTQIAQYQGVMNVSQILADTTVGQSTFGVDTVAGLANGDLVYVMDNSSIVYARTISLITGTNVMLNSGIPVTLSVANQARIVLMK